MHVFLSSSEPADHGTESLTKALEERGATVTHTPHPQPSDWYSEGLKSAVGKSEAFVSVLTPLWEDSTWMQHEALAGLRAFENGDIRRFCFFNPRGLDVKAAGMASLLLDQLPDEASQAAENVVISLIK